MGWCGNVSEGDELASRRPLIMNSVYGSGATRSENRLHRYTNDVIARLFAWVTSTAIPNSDIHSVFYCQTLTTRITLYSDMSLIKIVSDAMGRIAPLRLAEKWDNVRPFCTLFSQVLSKNGLWIAGLLARGSSASAVAVSTCPFGLLRCA
jgi:hypothetical protein